MLRPGVIESEDEAPEPGLVQPARHRLAQDAARDLAAHTATDLAAALASDDEEAAFAGAMRPMQEIMQAVMGLGLAAAMKIDLAVDLQLAAAEAVGLALVDADGDAMAEIMDLRQGVMWRCHLRCWDNLGFRSLARRCRFL